MNSTRKFLFGLVTHSPEIVDSVRRCHDPEHEELVDKIVDLDQAVPAARQLLHAGFEVILGHGGTGALIAESIGRSVINIPTTHLEVARAAMKARTFGRQIGVTSFSEPREGIDLLEDYLKINVRQILFRSNSELEAGVRQAIQDGYDVIVGGGVSRGIVRDLGGRGVIIEPNPKAVLQALRQARAMAEAGRREREQEEQVRTILQLMHDGVVGIDRFGMLNFFNRKAAEILNIDFAKKMGQSLSRVSKDLGLIDVLSSKDPLRSQIRKLSGLDLVVDTLPIMIDNRIKGAVAVFREARIIQDIDRKLRERLYAKGFAARHGIDAFKGTGPEIISLKTKVRRYAVTEAAILLQGETGSGKELLAHAIHKLSPRRDRPFVAVNCAALPETLLESELFGYEEGAFTGAKKGGKIGLFELANEGTIFLDEIGDIPISLQVRLLRVLEAKEVMRVGGDRIDPVDVRVVSSSCRNLRREVQKGRFRADLYFRLAVLKLFVPPLRERFGDVPLILSELIRTYGKGPGCVTPRMRERIEQYDWPGNVRELRSLIESYLILCTDRPADEDLFFDLMDEACDQDAHESAPPRPVQDDRPVDLKLKDQMQDLEHQVLMRTLRHCNYNRKLAAKKLGISVNTLWRKMRSKGAFQD